MDTAPFHALVRAILDILDAGLPQDEAVAHFIASTHGPVPPAGLEALLADRDDPQGASLAELLLFPGTAVALALEPALAAARLDADGQRELAGTLAASARQATAVLPDGERLTFPLQPDDLRRFVGRLAPARNLPDDLRRLLAERFGPEAALAHAVVARHLGPDWTPAAASFFGALLARLRPDVANAPATIRYVLRFLGSLPEGEFPLPALAARRGRLASQLRRARQQEEVLARSNFETLAMTGNRLPYLHAPDIAHELALADTALLAMTGRPPDDPAGVGQTRDLGDFEAVEDLLRALGNDETG